MIGSTIDATVFYKHALDEVEALQEAILPMADHIDAVALNWEKKKMGTILAGEYFRYREASAVRKMLLRACNHARYHLDEYFPLMREGIIADTERLEEAVLRYWQFVQFHHQELTPTK